MADVVNAPLAEFDGRDWHEFNDFALLSALQKMDDGTAVNYFADCSQINDFIDNKSATMLDSNEANRLASLNFVRCPTISSDVISSSSDCSSFHDTTADYLCSDFSETSELSENHLNAEDTICRCFRAADATDKLASIQHSGHQNPINDNPVWLRVADSFNNVPSTQWSQTCARKLQEKSLDLLEQKNSRPSNELDLSDDEELRQSMDLHSLITHCDPEEEPLATADQVISEIEEMMEDDNTISSVTMPKSSELIRQRLKRATVPRGSSIADGLKALTVSDLASLVDELEGAVQLHSETLVTELAAREELEFLKELNNQFISLLLSIQRRRREASTPNRAVTPSAESSAGEKKKVLHASRSSTKTKDGSSCSLPGVYLTTVVPYDHHDGSPDVTRLQIYIKILSAIDSDSSAVPTLLTDYILKVLCPTS